MEAEGNTGIILNTTDIKPQTFSEKNFSPWLVRVFVDLTGEVATPSFGYKYAALYCDHHSRNIAAYLLQHKDQAFDTMLALCKQWQGPPKEIVCDKGGEFVTSPLVLQFTQANFINIFYALPNHHETTGVIERLMHLSLHFYKSSDPMEAFLIKGYSDSSFADVIPKRHSTIGWCLIIGHSVLTWSSKTLKTVVTSVMEAEVNAAFQASRENVHQRSMLSEMGLGMTTATPLYVDNEGIIKFVRNGHTTELNKHFTVKPTYLGERIDDGSLHLKYISTNENIADLFTKNLPYRQFNHLRSKILRSAPH